MKTPLYIFMVEFSDYDEHENVAIFLDIEEAIADVINRNDASYRVSINDAANNRVGIAFNLQWGHSQWREKWVIARAQYEAGLAAGGEG